MVGGLPSIQCSLDLSKLWRVLAKVSADKVVLLVFDVLPLIFAAISPGFTFCPVFCGAI